ncbi:methylaspartate mutase [Actinacidiphila acidipaludis]|uniref:Methylaspartate mutase n=1 Tax=Actinacidiphila acidipaludis TaxID=2873382 RepID=A0ABS7QHP8_9ACTN|nr:methylaspartate mutase [Streptomyces acidipaludis]MBY8882687.1 methylaspartate mutase [Streptomyces acidipaludis]
MTAPAPSLGRYVAAAAAAGGLVVQPRMGFGDPRHMRAGLVGTRDAAAVTVGTVTIDSYTRVGDPAGARRALAEGGALNGYPIVSHPAAVTRSLLRGVHGPGFPVQVRHGSSHPEAIIRALTAVGLDATEGGPVSYCLPYGRTPLRASVDAWARGCELLAELAPPPRVPHLETFGGCLLGQLCPPGLLVAVSLLEALFFVEHGIREVSLSYAQQTSPEQDREAVAALRRLAAEFLPPDVHRHIVLYTYMGVFPSSAAGADLLLRASARLAVRSGAQRLIVKTPAEAHRIPTVAENVRALESAAAAAEAEVRSPADRLEPDSEVYAQARTFVEAVLELGTGTGTGIGEALRSAFARGYLDVPYCLHPDNAGRSRSFIDDRGRLRWSRTGAMPVAPDLAPAGTTADLTSSQLLAALHTMARRFDLAAEAAAPTGTAGSARAAHRTRSGAPTRPTAPPRPTPSPRPIAPTRPTTRTSGPGAGSPAGVRPPLPGVFTPSRTTDDGSRDA